MLRFKKFKYDILSDFQTMCTYPKYQNIISFSIQNGVNIKVQRTVTVLLEPIGTCFSTVLFYWIRQHKKEVKLIHSAVSSLKVISDKREEDQNAGDISLLITVTTLPCTVESRFSLQPVDVVLRNWIILLRLWETEKYCWETE